MDTTIKGIPVNEETITRIINEILDIEIDLEISYKLIKLTPIRNADVYEDFSASIECKFGKINARLNIDITTGDVITPREIKYSYSRILEEGTIPIITYTIETILAEKFETISSRNITTTRARDFYDLYMIYNMYNNKINQEILGEAIVKTARQRGSLKAIRQYKEIVELFKINRTIKNIWDRYAKNNPYTKDIKFSDTVEVYKKIGNILDLDKIKSV